MAVFDFSNPKVLKWEIQETNEDVELVVDKRSNTLLFANFDSAWSLNATAGSCTLSVSAHVPQSSNPTDNALDNATISDGTLTLSCSLKTSVVSGVMYGGTGELRASFANVGSLVFRNPASGQYNYVRAFSVTPQTTPDNWAISNVSFNSDVNFKDNIYVVNAVTGVELCRSGNDASNYYRLDLRWDSANNRYDVYIGIPHTSALDVGANATVNLLAKSSDTAKGLPAIWTEQGFSFNLTRSL